MKDRRAEATSPDYQHPRGLQTLLPGTADFRQENMALVAFDFVRAQRVHVALHFFAVMP
jgi:hypothetical protein